MNLKCNKCKKKQTIDPLGNDLGRLLHSFSVRDRNGKRSLTVYCRACRHISYYRSALFGTMRLVRSIDARALYSKSTSGSSSSREELSVIAPHIQLAMVEDRVLPTNWELV